jgi:succinate dehydrogenase hydrophobic anchor subunit
MWAWLMQRVTAVLLIVCLAIHLTETHILNIGKLNSHNILVRLANRGMVAVDLILLLRMVLMDYWFTSRSRARMLCGVLWVAGIVLMVYGTWALWPWIGPK